MTNALPHLAVLFFVCMGGGMTIGYFSAVGRVPIWLSVVAAMAWGYAMPKAVAQLLFPL